MTISDDVMNDLLTVYLAGDASADTKALVEAHAEIAEMDLNPLIVHPAGAIAVDARIRLEIGAPRPPLSAR